MDWFHYMLLGLNALLLVLFIARSAPQHWVVPAASGAGEAASAEGAIAGELLQARKRSWWKRELTVTMRGAASGAGDVRCLDPPRCREMSVAYRLWDVGEYLATVHIGCANLRFSPHFFPHLNKTAQHDLVTWRLTVLHRTTPNSTHAELHSSSSRSLASGATADYPAPQSDQISPEKPTPSLPHLQATTPHLNPPEANPRLGSLLPANPCAGTSVPTRWKLSNGTYHWTPYFCAHRELPRMVRGGS
ncbi:hypothetical protein CLOM_g15512 [Closterium sp. NIES-68]|nr:hypothetical protein CLOM_g15512 [Closterium sp. NIES-68]